MRTKIWHFWPPFVELPFQWVARSCRALYQPKWLISRLFLAVQQFTRKTARAVCLRILFSTKKPGESRGSTATGHVSEVFGLHGSPLSAFRLPPSASRPPSPPAPLPKGEGTTVRHPPLSALRFPPSAFRLPLSASGFPPSALATHTANGGRGVRIAVPRENTSDLMWPSCMRTMRCARRPNSSSCVISTIVIPCWRCK